VKINLPENLNILAQGRILKHNLLTIFNEDLELNNNKAKRRSIAE